MKFIHAPKLMELLGYKGITIYPFVFYKGDLNPRFKNHESIHIQQQIELLVVPFYILYGILYAVNRIKGMNHNTAYRSNFFEKEAYDNEHNLKYLNSRKRFAWFIDYFNL